MRKDSAGRALPIATMAACFAVGIAAGWWLHASGGPQPVNERNVIQRTADTVPPARTPDPARPRPRSERDPEDSAANAGGAIEILRQHRLRVPVDGVDIDALKSAFTERRTGEGGHTHEAVDILAPRETPVRAIEDGTVAKLFESKAGGHTIYQFDPTERFAYYYAHLERYADGLHDGQRISAGEVIGYVGTSGNAPVGTPHLHFAIFELGPEKRWWKGEPIDPYLVFKK